MAEGGTPNMKVSSSRLTLVVVVVVDEEIGSLLLL